MIRFFKGQKLGALKSNSAIKYLLYAVGEIILVVVGILIALWINNKNESSKLNDELNGILKNVSYDLELDTLLVGQVIKYYEAREDVADKITKNELTPEDYKSCQLCGSIITTYAPISLNDKGYNQLRAFNENSQEKDSLAVSIVQFYSFYSDIIDEISANIKENTFKTLEQWRDTKPWFADIMSNQANPEYFKYISESADYRNKVAYFNILAIKNLLPILKQYNANAIEVLSQLDERLQHTTQK